MSIDFTNCPVRNKTYAGANGSKISVIYDGHLYMLKFPSAAAPNKEMSYANGCISEYLGCHIFETVGIPVQETLLGTYTKNGKDRGRLPRFHFIRRRFAGFRLIKEYDHRLGA